MRRRLRGAEARRDRDVLEKLAEEKGSWSQPMANLVLLARALWNVGNPSAAERLKSSLIRRGRKRRRPSLEAMAGVRRPRNRARMLGGTDGTP